MQKSVNLYHKTVTIMKNNKFKIVAFLFLVVILNACKDSDISPLDSKPVGTFEGTWSGRGNSGVVTLHNLKVVDDPNSDYDKVTGSVTMLSLNSKEISFGEYNNGGNILTIKVNDGANTYTFIASYKSSEKSLENGSWLVSGNSGAWSATKK